MGELSKLPNIGEKLEKQLEQVGITTYEQLCESGSEKTWLEIQKIDSSACIHRLLALEGAIRKVMKKELEPEVKAKLKQFYTENKI